MKALTLTTITLSLLATFDTRIEASSHPPMTLDAVVKRADVGFVGRVIEQREEPLADRRMTFTHVKFEVTEWIFGRADADADSDSDDRLTLTFAGGRFDDAVITIPGVPVFETGDEVILFVRNDGGRYADPTIGGPQGLFRIVRDLETGVPHPVTAGGRGLVLDDNGVVETTERIESIERGAPAYREVNDHDHGHGHEPTPEAAPAPVATTPSASARVSEVTRASRPNAVADLDGFITLTRALSIRSGDHR